MMQEILKSAKERYDLVLVDCASLKDFKDAVVVSNYIDCVAIVVKEGRTRRQVVKSAILNNRTFAIPKAIYEKV